MPKSVHVNDKVHDLLREISAAQDRRIDQVIEDAVMRYQRDLFWQEVEASVERLRADQDAWADYRREMDLLQDGGLTQRHIDEGL
jgi:hypothetical protein